MDKIRKRPNMLQALLPILVLLGLIYLNVKVFDDALGGANQLALIIAAGVSALIGLNLKYSWNEILKGITKSIHSALPAILILMLIGGLAGTWLISGIVPTMIYYGLEIIHPKVFLVTACIVCAIVSLATGSSWTTVATVGVALLGIGTTLGFNPGLVGGAIISGAYFGDKMSPLSDTTNLAPAMAGTDLFTHIRYMLWTTIPSFSIALILFLIFGISHTGTGNIDEINSILSSLNNTVNITPWLFLVPIIVIVLILKKVPAIPALLAGVLLGSVFAIIFQPELIQSLGEKGAHSLKNIYTVNVNAITSDIQLNSGNELVDGLLSTSGMYGMMNTIWLILCAMCFGGAMEAIGLLQRLTDGIMTFAKSTGGLIASTAATCLGFNATASDQYLAIVVPGKMFKDVYEEKGLAPENLSRTLEDTATVTSALIPWNTCGAYHAGVLNMYTGDYFMYCFFNLISPVMTITYGYLGIKIAKLKK